MTICGRCAAGEVALDLVGEMMDVDHRALDALLGEPVEHVVDQRLAADRDQRLGQLAVERPHARAEPGGEHHGAFRRVVIRAERVSAINAFCSRAFRLCLTPAHGRYTTR